MPKYIPTYEDSYVIKPCAVCGSDVLDENSNTCCSLCEQHWDAFLQDLKEQSIIEEEQNETNSNIIRPERRD